MKPIAAVPQRNRRSLGARWRYCARLMCVIGWLFPYGLAGAATALSFTSPNGSFSDGISRMIGWQFEVANAIVVTDLGWQDFGGNGLIVAHEVGIWNATTTPTLLGSTIVGDGTSATLSNFFRYVPLGGGGIVLNPGTTYVIAGFDPGNGDPQVWDADIGFGAHVNGFSFDPGVLLGAPGTPFGPVASQFEFPANPIGDLRRAPMGPNFQFQPALFVPLPPAAVLLLSGLAALGYRRKRRPA
jgi:hypothetical protein